MALQHRAHTSYVRHSVVPFLQPGQTKQPRMTKVYQAANEAGREVATVGVLFVCLGNICRSPAAEAVFIAKVKEAGLQSRFRIDSCGTGGGSSNWFQDGGFSNHEGDLADGRMTAVASKRGILLTSRSRPLGPPDFGGFDYIIGMDEVNMKAINTAASYWQGRKNGSKVPEDYKSKLSLMMSYCSEHTGSTVPDPYYGGTDGFENVLDLLDDACSGLLKSIRTEYSM